MTERRPLSDPAVQQALGRKTHKYHAKRTEVDGRVFDSAREAKRYTELRLLQQAGKIYGLTCQQSFDLHVLGVKVATYRADFSYSKMDGSWCVEDVKSEPTKTPVYRLKVKMLAAEYGIRVKEV